MNVPIFWQRNPKYQVYFLDDSPYTFWDFGCLLCSISSVLKFYGKNTDPISLDADLSKIGGIDKSGLIHWYKVTELYPDLSLDLITCGTDPAPLATIDDALNNNFPVIAETRWGQKEDSMHFVVLTKKNGEYMCMEPFEGKMVSFNQKFGDPSRWIYSIAIYKSKAGSETIEIEKDVFERLVSNSSKFDELNSAGYGDITKIKQIIAELNTDIEGKKKEIETLKNNIKAIAVTLKTTDAPSDILGEITKLITLEDRLYISEQNLKIAQDEWQTIKEDLTTCDTTKAEILATSNKQAKELSGVLEALQKATGTINTLKEEVTRLKSIKAIEKMSTKQILSYLLKRMVGK